MVECKYCDEEFENKEKLHLHWGESHEDELNSHDKEKVKKAKRKKDEQKNSKMQKRRKLAGKGLAIGGVLLIAVVLGQQALDSLGTGQTRSFNLEGQPVLGNPNASVTVVEFGDYQCPYCRQFEENTFPQIKENYIDTGDVKFQYINYAFLGQDSTEAAVASECVYDQTGNTQEFWDFHHAIFDNQGAERSGWVTPDLLMELARNNTEGLDYEGLRQCITNQETLSEVRSDRQMGSNNGVTGTPSVYVNGRQVPTDYASIRAAIEQELG